MECLQCPVIPQVCPWLVLKAPILEIAGFAVVPFFPLNFLPILYPSEWHPSGPKTTERDAKGVPIEHYFRLFGATSGNAKAVILCR